ncbi:MAG: ribosome hibernation-promoting factor, HPF/YfiA family, partial [Nevskiales bacterium]
MNLQISGHHVDVTDALRSFVSTKMRRIERHFDHLIDASVILTVEKLRHKAEALS